MDKMTEALADYRRAQLAHHPNLQAEAIARHYTSLAATAGLLGELVQSVAHTGPTPTTNKAIAALTHQIKDAHLKCFGLELEWKANLN